MVVQLEECNGQEKIEMALGVVALSACIVPRLTMGALVAYGAYFVSPGGPLDLLRQFSEQNCKYIKKREV